MIFRLLSDKKKILNLDIGVFSFINLYSLKSLIKNENDTGFYYAVDGGLLCILLKLLYGITVERTSFDFTSIAGDVFQACINSSHSIAFVGGTNNENRLFVEKIKSLYPNIDVVLANDGYFDDNRTMSQSIIESNARVVLLGLGSDKQDEFAQILIDQGYHGSVFTCGGFMSQTANSRYLDSYYPPLVDKLHLRALYRFVYETHTRKRYLVEYPMSMLSLLLNVFQKKFKFERI